MSAIMHVFFDTHMAYQHKGLTEKLLKQTKKKPLAKGETALFISRDFCAAKLLTSDNVILYLRRPKHMPIRPETLRLLPGCVEGGALNYDKALRQVVGAQWKKLYPNETED